MCQAVTTCYDARGMEKDLISPTQAAELLDVHVVSVYRMLSQGRLTRYKRGVGRQVYLSRSEVLKLNEARPARTSG